MPGRGADRLRAAREAVRFVVTEGQVSLYLGGPCRVYGEASMEQGCAVVEVALLPMLRITGMSGFVAPSPRPPAPLDAVAGAAGPREVMEICRGWAAVEGLLCGPGFVETAEVDEEAAKDAAAAAGDVPEDDVAGEVDEVCGHRRRRDRLSARRHTSRRGAGDSWA